MAVTFDKAGSAHLEVAHIEVNAPSRISEWRGETAQPPQDVRLQFRSDNGAIHQLHEPALVVVRYQNGVAGATQDGVRGLVFERTSAVPS